MEGKELRCGIGKGKLGGFPSRSPFFGDDFLGGELKLMLAAALVKW